MNITIGFSPCPNDTFMFDALIHKKIDTQGITFIPVIQDVQELNIKCLNGELDVSKISYHAFSKIYQDYIMSTSGSALGRGVGPLLISKTKYNKDQVSNLSVAIPGVHTTAAFLLDYAFPELTNKTEMIFHEIEGSILSGKVDGGVIIHENRFTYEEKGLHKIIDLGSYWEEQTKLPIPLGGICVSRNFSSDMQQKISRLLKESVAYAFAHPESSRAYVKQYAQEMEADIVNKHITTYVNPYSLDIGKEGKSAVIRMFEEIIGKKIEENNLFV
jgi:1,4-dihydroxy-6-naphthoate synthase